MDRRWRPGIIGSLVVLAASLVLIAVAAARMAGAGWEAVAALASVFSALGTGAAALALYFAAREFDRREQERSEQVQRDRVSQKPYLRVDIAFAEPEGREVNLRLPDGMHIYSAEELGIDDELSALRAGVGPTADDEAGFQFVIYLSNLQSQPLGIADDVELILAARWSERRSTQFPIRLAYLAPGQTTAVAIATVRRAIPSLGVEVRKVSYKDLFQETMLDAHGAMRMHYTWDHQAGRATVRNERKVQRKEPLRDQRNGGDISRP